MQINSRQNPLFKQLKAMQTRSGRDKAGLYLLEGVRLIEEAIAARVRLEYAVYSDYLQRNQRGRACLESIVALGIKPILLDERLLHELAGTERPQGLLVAAHIPNAWVSDNAFWTEGDVWLVLDGVQDPGNLGTILRTAEAFGVERVVALKGTVDPYNEKVIRSAMGSIFRLPLLHDQNTDFVLTKLRQNKVQIVVSSLEASEPYQTATFAQRLALVVGNEGAGVDPIWTKTADLSVKIPMQGQAESLNVAVAAGILLAKIVESRS